MTTLLTVLVLGTIWGAQYSLIAVGFTLIFGVARLINLAHGSFYMLGAYFAYTFMTVLEINTIIAAFMAVAATVFIGMVIDRFGIKAMRQNHHYVLIFTLCLALFLQELIFVFYGVYGKAVKSFISGEVVLLDLHITYHKILTLFVSGTLILLLWLFIKKTKTGKSIAAVAQNKDAAIFVGIQDEKVYLMTAAISAGLAGVAGLFIAPIIEAFPTMWVFPLFRAFVIVIIGGLGSISGAIIASMLLGYSETFVSLVLSPNYSDMVYLVAIILVLTIRPMGLMGKSAE